MGLLLDNGAIADLMRQMTGGGTQGLLGSPVNGPDAGAPAGPAPMAPQMAALGAGPGAPIMGAPPVPAGPPGGPMPTTAPDDNRGGLLRRILGGDQMPPGYDAVSSPSDLQQAKPGLLHLIGNAILGDSGPDLIRKNLDQMMATRQAAMGIQQQRQQQTDFNAIRQKYAAPLDAAKTVQDKFDVLTSMAGDLMRIGHPEGAKMAGVLKDLRPLNAPAPMALIQRKGIMAQSGPNAGKTVDQLFDPASRSVVDEQLAGAPPMSEDAKIFRTAAQAIAMQGQADANERAAASRAETEARRFDTEAKPYTDFVSKYQNFQNALEQARAQNPAAYRTVLLNYMNSEATTPGRGQLGILKYLSDMDPSIHGQMSIAIDRLTKGAFSPQVLANMEAHIAGKYQTFSQQYDRLRNARIASNPRLANVIPATETVFPGGRPEKYTSHSQLTDAQMAATPAKYRGSEQALLDYWNSKK